MEKEIRKFFACTFRAPHDSTAYGFPFLLTREISRGGVREKKKRKERERRGAARRKN